MFSITSPVRVDALYRYAKREGVSFFILCLFVLLKALNRVPQLRQRVEEGEVWEYESVNALVPVLAADGEFTQILVEYRMEMPDFLEHAVPLVQAAKLAPAQGESVPQGGYRRIQLPAVDSIHTGGQRLQSVPGPILSPYPLGEGGGGCFRQDGDARSHSGEPCAGGRSACGPFLRHFWKNCAEINSVKRIFLCAALSACKQ